VTGTILVESPAVAVGAAVAYCRVSSAEQRADLERQAGRVAEECGTRGITLAATITEIGSGVFGEPGQAAEAAG
jgi:putative resolvase